MAEVMAKSKEHKVRLSFLHQIKHVHLVSDRLFAKCLVSKTTISDTNSTTS
jgi:hypothetical protein